MIGEFRKVTVSMRVKLEPELEEMAMLWPAARRLEAARKLERWARQLRISAKIMISDALPKGKKPPCLPRVPRRKLALN